MLLWVRNTSWMGNVGSFSLNIVTAELLRTTSNLCSPVVPYKALNRSCKLRSPSVGSSQMTKASTSLVSFRVSSTTSNEGLSAKPCFLLDLGPWREAPST